LYRPVPLDIGGSQYTLQMIDFLEAVANYTDLQSNVASGLKTQLVIDAVYESARLGGTRVSVSTLHP